MRGFKRNTKMVLMLTGLGFTGMVNASVLTNSNIDSRLHSSNISFSDLTFFDAKAVITTTMQFSGNIGDSGSFVTTGQRDTIANYSMSSGSGISLTSISAPSAINNYIGSFDVTITGTTNDFVSFTKELAVATAAEDSNIMLDTSTGFNTLKFLSPGSGPKALKTNGVFTITQLIAGDWSSQGTGVGQAELTSLSSDWVVTKSFVYDSVSNKTQFEAINYLYSPTAYPNLTILTFALHGTAVSAVPLPSVVWLFLTGLGVLSFNRRKKVIN